MKKKLTWNAAACLVFVFVLTIGFTGCKKSDANLTPGDIGSDKEIYEKAKKKIKRDPEKARLLFKEIMHLYPDSIYSRRAKIGIADSYFRQKDSASLIMAATEYQEFVNLYPNSPDAVYAKMQIAMCYYKQKRSAGRDQSNNKEALKALESLVRQYPDTKEAQDAKDKIKKIRLILAEHYFRIGKSNYQLKAFKGAVVRFKQVMDDYPDYPNVDKLFYYTGSCYYKMRNLDSALSFFQKIINSHPKSKYLKKSKKMIKKTTELKEKYVKMAKTSKAAKEAKEKNKTN